MNGQIKKYCVDPRVYLALILIGSIAAIYIHTEYGMLMMFALSLLWQIAAARGKGVIAYILLYTVFFGITRASIWWMSDMSINTTALAFSSFGLTGRKALTPILYAVLLARIPTGTFLGALYAMRLPKAVGIGTAIGMRFFPTVSQEYRQIRNAQKFRGLGVGFFNTLVHLPSVLTNILLPLIVRIVKISEELSASVTVRGVRFHNQVVSYRPVHFCGKDLALLSGTTLLYTVFILLDHYLLGVTT